jgi:hypothetical protein
MVPLLGQSITHAATDGGYERFANVLVSATGSTGNTINEGNTSRNVGVSSDGTIYVAYTGIDGIYVARSTDQGQSFTLHTKVSTDSGSNIQPEINVDSDGIVYVAWVVPNSGDTALNIMVSRSTDNGATFSTPVQAGTAPLNSGAFPINTVHMATDANYVYLITPDGENLYYSTDGGVTFQSTNLSSSAFVFSDVHVDPSNRDVIVQEDMPAIKYYISTDHGQSFGAEIDPTDQTTGSQASVNYSVGDVSAGPSGDFLYISGMSPSSYKIDLSNSNPSTNTTTLTFPSDASPQGRSISTDGYGNVVTGYSDGTNVYFAVSQNFGSTFGTPVDVTTGTEAKASINSTNGDVLYVYQDTQGHIYLNVYSNELVGYEPNLSTSALTFGAESVGTTSQPQTITLTNNSTSPLIISQVTTTGPFSATGGVGTIQPGGTTQIQVAFTPTTTGTQTGTLQIFSNAPSSPRVINLSSTNVAALSIGSLQISQGATVASNTLTASVGTQMSATMTATGGTAPYNYSVVGTLPAGLSFDSQTGVMSGAPTTSGTSSATLEVTDSSGLTATLPLTFTIQGGASSSQVVGSVYFTTNSSDVISGGTKTVSGVVYDVYGVPVSNTNVNLSSTLGYWGSQQEGNTGTVTTDVNGNFSATWNAPIVNTLTPVSVTASVYNSVYTNPVTSSATYTLAPPITPSSTTLPVAIEDTHYSQAIAMTGGFGSYTYSLASGSFLPNGLSLDPTTGVISGTPTTSGSHTFAVIVTDSDGYTTTANLSLNVSAPDLTNAVITPGSTTGATSVTASVGSGHQLEYVLANNPNSSSPDTGDPVPSDAKAYTSGTDIPAVPGQYLDMYEMDVNGNIVAYHEYALTGVDISAPDLTNASVAPGITNGTTSLTASVGTGDRLAYVLGNEPISSLPGVGDSAPSDTVAYTSGAAILATSGQYLDMYELDGNGKIVLFHEYPIMNVDISAPDLANATIAQGSATGTTSVTANVGSGLSLAYVLGNSSVSSVPIAGDPAPSAAIPYTSGTDIPAAPGQYLDMYEVNGNGKIVAYHEYPLASTNVRTNPYGHDHSGSSSNVNTGTTTSGATTNGTGNSTGSTATGNGGSSDNYFLPTVKSQQTVGTGATTVQKTFGNTDVQVNIPDQALSTQQTVTITTGTLAHVQSHAFTGMTTKNTPLLVGVYFSGKTTNKPVTVTVTQPNIPPHAKVYDLIPGVGYVQVPAQVSKGQIVTTVSGNTSMAIVNVLPNQRAITLGTHIAIVPEITKQVKSSQATYLPVWYVMKELKSVGIQSSWNGRQWNLTASNQSTSKPSSPEQGSMSITLNGSNLLQKVNGVTAVDPYSGKTTTYMPLSSMDGLMNQLGIKTTWNGTTWSLADQLTQKKSSNSSNTK